MHEHLLALVSEIEITGDIQRDVRQLLFLNGLDEVAEHSLKVANEARRLAGCFEASEEKAFIAGLLHDIGNVIPLQKRVNLCNDLGIQMFEEEKLAPSMLHPKLSRVIASEIFLVDEEICSAIECHSTMKADAGKLDLILFVADKTSWPVAYNRGFIGEMLKGLNISLEYSALKYLEYIIDGHAQVMHPRAIEAYNYLKGMCKQ